MTEQRRHNRIVLDRAISIKLSSGQLIHARLVNLSTSGVGVLYPAPAEIGSTLGLHFQLPGEGGSLVTIHCTGTVCHTYVHGQDFFSGFKFAQIREEDLNVIKEFIHRKRPVINNQVVIR